MRIGFPSRMGVSDRRHTGSRTDPAFRIYMGGLGLICWYMSMEIPDSLSHSVAQSTDGAALIWLQALLGACAVFDAFVNDVLPERWHWRFALRQRHYIMVGMAFGFLTQIFSAVWQSRFTGLELFYTWNAIVIMYAAFPDAYQRLKDSKCSTANNS